MAVKRENQHLIFHQESAYPLKNLEIIEFKFSILLSIYATIQTIFSAMNSLVQKIR